MAKVWQLQEAKNKLSQVVRAAGADGPQTITVRGREAVVVLSCEDYRRLAAPGGSLAEFLATSPLSGLELEIERDPDHGREVRFDPEA